MIEYEIDKNMQEKNMKSNIGYHFKRKSRKVKWGKKAIR